MSKQQILVDDLTGDRSEDVTTVPFSVEHRRWEIDLTEENRRKLYEVLEEFIAAARRIPAGARTAKATSGRRNPAPRLSPTELEKIRVWARENGHRVADRGRPPAAVLKAYREAHPK